jgi:hypothetical protein
MPSGFEPDNVGFSVLAAGWAMSCWAGWKKPTKCSSRVRLIPARVRLVLVGGRDGNGSNSGGQKSDP